MDVTPQTPKGRQLINRYGNGGFTVNETGYTGNILILPEQVHAWAVENLAAATPASFEAIITHMPAVEILLIGVGQTFTPLPPELQTYFRQHNIAADAMDTGAACRTYNVLLAEDRRVAAALIAV